MRERARVKKVKSIKLNMTGSTKFYIYLRTFPMSSTKLERSSNDFDIHDLTACLLRSPKLGIRLRCPGGNAFSEK